MDFKITDAAVILYVRKLRLPSTDFFLKPISSWKGVCAFVKRQFILIAAIFQEQEPFKIGICQLMLPLGKIKKYLIVREFKEFHFGLN